MDYYSSQGNKNIDKDEEQVFSLKDFVVSCLKYWQWFVCSVIIFAGFGYFYGAKKEPVYRRSIEVLIQNHDAGGKSDISTDFKQIGFLSSKANVNNELLTMTSPFIVSEVVRRLKLNTHYNLQGTFHPVTLYGAGNPVEVQFVDLDSEDNAGFKALLQPNGTVELSEFWKIEGGKKKSYDKVINSRLAFNPINTPIGRIILQPNGKFTGKIEKDSELDIWQTSYLSTVENYKGSLKSDLADKDADVIELVIENVSPQIADDFLNTIVIVYNENWIADKNKITVATNEFIDERLRVIESELGNVDEDISRYKSYNSIPNMEMVTGKQLTYDQTIDQGLLSANTDLAMAKYMRDFIFNPKNVGKVIPANIGLKNGDINQQIAEYNKLLIQYDQIVENSGVNNPIAREYKALLNGMYESLKNSMSGLVGTLEENVRMVSGAKNENSQILSGQPEKAKYLLSVERQQKVKEELYIYLLEKREENELSKAFTAYNTRVIQPPYGPQSPVAPKPGVIMAVCIFLGLALPAVIIYFIEATNTKIRSKKDLEGLSIPYIGEIPFIGKKNWKSRINIPFIKTKIPDAPTKVVKAGQRDLPNEAFRVTRSNLDFMLDKGGTSVIAVTSFNPGSGKSFLSFNLGESFALKDKKVLIIDGDLRHGSLSEYAGTSKVGLSNYLAGREDDWKQLVVKNPDSSHVDVLPIGYRPPNPAELLEGERLKALIEEAKGLYDIIIIDCPPVNIVVDTLLISENVDRTIFVVRTGMFDKSQLEELRTIYDSEKYKHLCIVLNGTTRGNSEYFSYGRYSYHSYHDHTN